jgi:hypothetical protein
MVIKLLPLISVFFLVSHLCSPQPWHTRADDGSIDRIFPISYTEGKKIARIENEDIEESSGMAISRLSEGVFWTHNDAGNKSRIFAFDESGRDLGTFRITDVKGRDWEDMASATLDDHHFLFIGDIGDNEEKRGFYMIIVVEEPEIGFPPDTDSSLKNDIKTPVSDIIQFEYEDDSYDCESLSIDPQTGVFYLVTKVSGKKKSARVFELITPYTKTVYQKKMEVKIHKKGGMAVYTAKRIAKLDIRNATGMDISSAGTHAVVTTTDDDAYQFVRNPGESWSEVFKRKPEKIKLPKRKQGESICYGWDGMTLYLTSEQRDKGKKKHTPLFMVPAVNRESKPEE